MLARIRRPAQVLFLLLALLFIALLLWSQWDELRTYPWQLRPVWLIPAALALLASWGVEVSVWRRLLRLLGGEIEYGMGFRIWFVSAIMRYIPGNVWQPLGMTVLAHRQGVRAEATITSIVLYQVVNLLAVAVIAALYFPLTGNLGLFSGLTTLPIAQLLVFVLLPVVIFLARPQWLIRALNWLLRKVGRPPLVIALSTSELLRAIILTVGTWLLLGLSYAALVMALTGYRLADIASLWPHLMAGYPVAYAVGYLSFVTPSGLAVREGTLYLLLAPILGGGVVTATALAMRVWLVLGELAAAGISVLTWPGGLRIRRNEKPAVGVASDG
ncbi:MAG: flippase-like domain-containing protein [Caldilineales bacterium]|nr:flippase-like domain-containing protein [Caldilineales bacterium]